MGDSLRDAEVVGIAPDDRRGIGWSSGPKRWDYDHAHQKSGPLHSVVRQMAQDLFAMTARAQQGDTVTIRVKVTSGKPAWSQDKEPAEEEAKQARAAGAEELRAQVRETLDANTRRLQTDDLAPGQRLVKLLEDLRALAAPAPEESAEEEAKQARTAGAEELRAQVAEVLEGLTWAGGRPTVHDSRGMMSDALRDIRALVAKAPPEAPATEEEWGHCTLVAFRTRHDHGGGCKSYDPVTSKCCGTCLWWAACAALDAEAEGSEGDG